MLGIYKCKILIAEPEDFSQKVITELSKVADINLHADRIENLKEALNNYDIFWFRLAYKIDQKVLSAESKCKILVTPVTGIDHIDEALCEKLGVKIICLRGERTFLKEVKATAEHTMGLMLALMRNIVPATESVKSGIWNRDLFRGNELYQKTLGIIGFGRLGALVAEYAYVFGMQVVSYDIRKEVQDDINNVKFVQNIEDLIVVSDVVSIHINYNITTHHLINQRLLNLFKQGSYFINTSRGGIVDENALLDALQSGKIKGAAIDVLQNEHNLNESNPLIQYARNYNNLIITPHIGGNTFESFEKTELFIANKLISFLNTKTKQFG
jgi:D-3-phosphoglycerate dehydrogenase / 2-oxoglutarate reductase